MDKALKQRLVGASVLIALAVVVLPMLLGGQPENQQEARSIEVPPRPSELSFETRRFPLGEHSPDQPSVVEEAPPQNTESDNETFAPEQEDSAPTTSEASVTSKPEVRPAQRQVDTETETSLPGRYLVQVASFSTMANANRLAARLRNDGMSVMMDSIEAAVGTLHRVRVGPFDEVVGANAAISEIRSQTPDVNPRIIDLRPDESSPVTDPADPLARWVVQVGSFSDSTNAQGLVGQLRSAGFNAYSVTVTGTGGTRYKVRVGPEFERQSALRIAADIRSKMNLDGIVMVAD